MRPTTLLIAAALVTGSCATPQTDEEVRAIYVDAAASAFTSGEGGPPLPDEVADCVAAALVDLPGVDALREADVDGQELADAPDLRSLDVELPEDAVDRLAVSLGDCGLAGAIERPLLDTFAAEAGAELTDDAAACVTAAADDAAVERGLAETFVDRRSGTPGFDALLAGLEACPDATTEVLVSALLTDPEDASRGLRECVAGFVRADPVAAARALVEPPSEERQSIVDEVFEACIQLSTDG